MFDHPHPFDPTYGYDLDALLGITPPDAPDGFDAFWQDTYQQTMAVDPEPAVTFLRHANGWTVSELEYTGLAGFRVGGWLLAPQEGEVTAGFVQGHGYGGREAPDLGCPVKTGAVIFPCARGFHRSARPDLPDNSNGHVVHGLEDVETYLHRFCVTDLWSAGSALLALYPQLQRFHYSGGSFGGGIGAMALPWDARIERAHLVVPSFGHHPLRLTMPCVGSGEAVRRYYAEHPEAAEVLAFYDAAIHATRCQVPVLCAPAKFDPAVPPPGQYAVNNALAGEKERFDLSAGHFSYPSEIAEGREHRRRIEAWFGG